MWMWQNYLRYRLALRKHAKAEKQLEEIYPPNLSNDFNNGEFADYIRREDQVYQWKMLIQTEYFRNKADVLNVPMPDPSDKGMYDSVEWDDDPQQPKYLTDKGVRSIKAAVREEEKHRREATGYWFGIVVGIIGALTGLISILKN
jgi:hypothetical protein